MLKRISIAFCSLALATVCACSSTNSNTNQDGNMGSPDLSMQQQGTPDMSFVCVMNPMTNDDFLNSCAPASVDHYDVQPFYPALAPNGMLPPLQ